MLIVVCHFEKKTLDRGTTTAILVRFAECKMCIPCMINIDCGKCENCVDKTRKKKCINRECKVVGEYMLKKSQQQRRKRKAKMPAEEITRLNKKKRTDYAYIAHIKKRQYMCGSLKRIIKHEMKNEEKSGLIFPGRSKIRFVFQKIKKKEKTSPHA